jgi:nitrogen fixation/metabolism regulation signal transduction histidine kinase
VEDNLLDRKSFERMIAKEGLDCEFTSADSVKSASEITESKYFDVAVVDYMLGDGTGFDLFDCLKNTPIIITTGAGDEETAVKAMKAGACDYIIKDASQNYLKFLPVIIENTVKNSNIQKRYDYIHNLNNDILQAIPSALIGVNSNFRITHWNKAAEQTFNISADKVLKKPFLYCGIDWDWTKVSSWVTDFYRNTHTSEIQQMRYVKPTGEIGCLNIKICPFGCENTESPGFLFVAEDNTEYKIMETQLVEAQKMKSMGKIASGIASQIKTPLNKLNEKIRQIENNINSVPETLEKSKAYITKEQLSCLQTCQSDIREIADILKATEQFSHPNITDDKIIDINRSINNILTVSKSYWKDTVSIRTNLSPDLPMVPCCGDTFNEIILNLLVNSVDSVRQKLDAEPSAKGIITLKTLLYSDWVQVHITDNGIGIPKEIQNKIFQPFFSTKQLGKGSGNGLTICRKLVQKEGGMISFESEFGKGATFTVHFNTAEKRNKAKSNLEQITNKL